MCARGYFSVQTSEYNIICDRRHKKTNVLDDSNTCDVTYLGKFKGQLKSNMRWAYIYAYHVARKE